MRNTVWFIWKSWSYLGCDSGTGRWKARREYLAGIIPKSIQFYIKTRKGKKIRRFNECS